MSFARTPAELRPALLALLMAGAAPAAGAMTLSEAWQRAQATDPVAVAAAATRDADREAGVQERATRLPRVDASGSYNNTDSEVVSTPFSATGFQERYNSWNAGVELRQPVFRYDWLARGRRADARDQQAELGYVQRSQALISRVAERYLGVLKAGNELNLASAEADAVRKSLSDTRKRYEVQLVPGTDLKEAQARDDLAQARLLSARQDVEAAQDALDETTGNGRAPLSVLAPTARLPMLDSTDPEVWVARARENSPAWRQALASHEVARADVESRRSEALPVVDLVASHSRQDGSESRVGSESNSTVVGVEIKAPLFSSGAGRSKVREAQARLRAADAERDRVERELLRDTRRLVRDVETARAQAAAYQRAADSAQAAEQATRYGYEAGKRTITDVLNAQSNTVQARRNLDQSRYDSVLKTLQLKQEVGLLSPDDLAAIDQLLTPAPATEPVAEPAAVSVAGTPAAAAAQTP